MDNWERLNETSLSEKKDFWNNLTMETLQTLIKNIYKAFRRILVS